ncbi:MAG: DUF4157 domain-containing protein [Methanosarcinales archaeon]|nr:DUF4157 domain-containing protein [Methanosarcinales archaeon]
MDDVCEQEADRVADALMQSSYPVRVKALLEMNTSPTQCMVVPPGRKAHISQLIGDRQYAPGTSEGRRLMAHELTHVMQQSGKK